MRLKSISLSKLHQTELISFVGDVMSVIEKHDLNSLHIKDASEMLTHYYPQVLKLAKEYGRCLVAEELRTVHMERVEYAGSILTQVLTLEKLKPEDVKKDLYIARLLVRLHLKGIRKHNRSEVNGKLWNFFNTLDSDLETKDAFQALDLMQYAERLRELDKRYYELYKLRSKVKVEAAKRSENKGIQNKAEKILRVFFAQLKEAQQIYPELKNDYAPLFAELNRVIPKYTKLIRTRATLNKKRAAAKAKANAEAKTELKTKTVNVDEKQSMSISNYEINEEKVVAKKPTATNKGKRRRYKKVVVAAHEDGSKIEKKNNLSHNKTDDKLPNTSISSADTTNPNDVYPLNSIQTIRNSNSVDGA